MTEIDGDDDDAWYDVRELLDGKTIDCKGRILSSNISLKRGIVEQESFTNRWFIIG